MVSRADQFVQNIISYDCSKVMFNVQIFCHMNVAKCTADVMCACVCACVRVCALHLHTCHSGYNAVELSNGNSSPTSFGSNTLMRPVGNVTPKWSARQHKIEE